MGARLTMSELKLDATLNATLLTSHMEINAHRSNTDLGMRPSLIVIPSNPGSLKLF